ncbi:HAD family phosphatase [Pseudovibrio exalbescens]|uniref:HAD family hydrolase n=1 Tax=Pseudovibrio exalbescens TaxID=197461 RepID=UPI002366E8D9|nr:HAD family phosphatase [Pseudovibrio exalbescens]MDD7910104.1 HAD family phosphatase [Pseudovibrio exalbescens]
MVSQINAVVFDIGNVLIRWDPNNLYRKLIPEDAEREHFLSTVCTMDWNIEQDRGRSWSDALDERIAAFPHHEEHIRAYYERWEEMLDGQIDGTVQLLEELKASGAPLYAITNFSSEKFEVAKQLFPFLATSFLDTVVSADEGLIKPDRQIYQTLIQRNGLQPESLVFIDDSYKNVLGAQAVGMQALHFEGAEKLRSDLKMLGLRW